MDAIAKELQRLARANGGLLQPEAVVDAARPAASPLHSRFEWDNSKAAEAYRLWQARQLIRVSVTVIGGDDSEPERTWVSLKSDRYEDSGGYRTLVSVMSDKEMRLQLMAQAHEDMDGFREKYRRLRELEEVFTAMKKVKRKG